MRRLNVFFITLLASLTLPIAGLVAASPADASGASSIYRECEVNGSITGHYTRAQLQSALNGIPSEVAEYSDCQDLIQQALVAASGPTGHHSKAAGPGAATRGKGGGGGSAGKSSGGAQKSGAGSPQKGGKGSGDAVSLAGSDIRPGSTGPGAATSSLPAALLIVLILLALTAVSGGAVAIRRRVVARQSA